MEKVIVDSVTTRDLVRCSLFTVLIIMGAFIKIPIPLVPFTLQFFFTNLAGILLGKKLASFSVGLYLFLGLIGLPIFSNGGGVTYIFQPTFGYLLGFLLGTWICGYFLEKYSGRKNSDLFAGIANLLTVYMVGVLYYYGIMTLYLDSAVGIYALLLYGVILAIPGDIILCFFSAGIGRKLVKILEKER